MPVYEYECNSCQLRFERWQKMHEEPVKTCPECGSATRRVLHPVGVIFKGSGFYVTDNRKTSTSSSSGSDKTESGSSSESSKSTSEKVESAVGEK